MRFLTLTLLCLLFTGCVSTLMSASRESITRSAILPMPVDEAYQKASRALAKMGAAITQANAQTHLLSGTVHQAVVLNVTVTDSARGAIVEVTGQLLPGKIVVGEFTEVKDYLALLQ